MNIYVIIEGEKAAKAIYSKWITYVNSSLNPVDYIDQVQNNHFIVYAGKGLPLFWERVKESISDVNTISKFDRLVIAVDSENASREQRLSHVKNLLQQIPCKKEVKIIIQHFCMETWFLGDLTAFRKKPNDLELINYMSLFNVRQNDPEDLPPYNPKNWNRAQFAYYYFRAGLHDTHSNKKFYSKKNPGNYVLNEGCFYQVKHRSETTKHIDSFNLFLEAFK